MFLRGSVQTRVVIGVFFLFGLFFLSQNALGASTISGTVYDKQRNILSEIDVELLNDYYQMIARMKTDSTGRYQFNGLRDGRYTVRVFAFRYDLEDQSSPVIDIVTVSIRGGEGSTFILQDFYLLPRKGGLAEAEIGVIFAQEVPPAAKKLYEKGVDEISKKRVTEGILELNAAIKEFPEYYLALHRIGRELFILKKYQEAIPFLIKAVQVNSKSATSFYYLGYSLHNLGKEYNKSAIAALNQAATLASGSAQVLFLLGKVERSNGNFEGAEKHLIQAKKLSKEGIPEIHSELAQLYGNDLKRYKEAADELELYLKTSKLSDEETKKTKKIISDLREKAKMQVSKS